MTHTALFTPQRHLVSSSVRLSSDGSESGSRVSVDPEQSTWAHTMSKTVACRSNPTSDRLLRGSPAASDIRARLSSLLAGIGMRMQCCVSPTATIRQVCVGSAPSTWKVVVLTIPTCCSVLWTAFDRNCRSSSLSSALPGAQTARCRPGVVLHGRRHGTTECLMCRGRACTLPA